jgi:hypothetical protein
MPVNEKIKAKLVALEIGPESRGEEMWMTYLGITPREDHKLINILRIFDELIIIPPEDSKKTKENDHLEREKENYKIHFIRKGGFDFLLHQFLTQAKKKESNHRLRIKILGYLLRLLGYIING